MDVDEGDYEKELEDLGRNTQPAETVCTHINPILWRIRK